MTLEERAKHMRVDHKAMIETLLTPNPFLVDFVPSPPKPWWRRYPEEIKRRAHNMYRAFRGEDIESGDW